MPRYAAAVFAAFNDRIYAKMLAADGTLLTVDGALSPEPPEPGTYPNSRISILATKTGETQPIGLDIPITLVVEE